MSKLSPAEIKSALPSVPDWKKKGAAIVKTFVFEDFAGAMKFANAVARAAEKANHHPDFEIKWNKVTLTLSTHDQGGLTDKDFQLARKLDELAA
jgi:4a-hydroxytetrahydrobiopterin dehydratase